MDILIVYDSATGTTAKAAEAMGTRLEANGHQCEVLSIAVAEPADVATADLIFVGSWVQGLFVIMQHPTKGTMQFIERLGDMTGKQVAVFCTYKLAAGSTLKKMAQALEGKGATVIGQFKYRGPVPDSKFASFAGSLK